MTVRSHAPFPYLAGLTVPLTGTIGLTVVLTSAYRGSDAWLIWSCAAVALAAASGAAFVHGLRRWAELAALGDVPLQVVARPLALLYAISGAVLIAVLRGELADAWRALVLIVLAGLGLAPGAATIVGVGHVARIRADTAHAAPGLQLDTLITVGRLLQSLLTVMGGIVALLVIAEATSQRRVRAAVAGRGQQLVEVSVAEAAPGLAVEVQPTGDRADRPAILQQAVDVLVAVTVRSMIWVRGSSAGGNSIGATSGTSATVSSSARLRRQSRCW